MKQSFTKSGSFLALIIVCLLSTQFGIFQFSGTGLERDHSPPQVAVTLTAHQTIPESQVVNREVSKSALKENIKDWRKKIKSELRELKKELKKNKNQKNSDGVKPLLVFLTILVAVALSALIGVLALYIGIGNSGMFGLGWIILILGLAAIIWLTIATIRNINKKGS